MKFVILILCLMLVGCDIENNVRTNPKYFNTICLDGVEYFMFIETHGTAGYGFMSVKFEKDGNVSLCEEETK